MESPGEMNGLPELLRESSEKFKESGDSVIRELAKRNIPLDKLQKMDLKDLTRRIDRSEREDLAVLYHTQRASSALSSSEYRPEVSKLFLESVQELTKIFKSLRLANELETAALKISSELTKCSSLETAIRFYADMQEIQAIDSSLDTLSLLLEGSAGTFYNLLNTAMNLNPEDLLSGLEGLISNLESLVKMDDLKVKFDYENHKNSIVLTTISLIDNEGISAEMKKHALALIKALNVDNQFVKSYLKDNLVEEEDLDTRDLPDGRTVILRKILTERKLGISISKGYIEGIGDVCVKEVRGDDSTNRRNMKREIRIFRKLSHFELDHHSNLPKFYGSYSIENTAIGMAFELCEETLSQELNRRSQRSEKFTSEELTHIANCLMRGLVDIHRHKYCHGDIKTSNLMRGFDRSVKIIDFDASLRIFDDGKIRTKKNKNKGLKKITEHYLAPEVSYCHNNNPEELKELNLRKADVFSAGITLLHLYYLDERRRFNTADDRRDLNNAIDNIQFIWLRNLLRKILEFDPNERVESFDTIALIQEFDSVFVSAPV